jgi:hypothetical protein
MTIIPSAVSPSAHGAPPALRAARVRRDAALSQPRSIAPLRLSARFHLSSKPGRRRSVISITAPCPPGCVTNVQDFDDRFAYAIEDLVGVTYDKHDPHIGIVSLISAVWLIAQPRGRFANAPCNIPRAAGGALSQIFQDSFTVRKTPRGCSEPSSSVAFVGLCDQLIGDELAPIRRCQAFSHGHAFVIRHCVNAGSPSFNLAGVLGEFVLIFNRPVRRVVDEFFERFRDHL